MNYKSSLSILAAGLLAMSCSHMKDTLPKLPPMPEVAASKPINSVPMGSIEDFEEVQLDIPITKGPFEANWESIEKNYPGSPKWLREAKFGIWVHFGPQSAGESGDWYARNLYKPGHHAYRNHLRRYGHPSEVGYKDVLKEWNPEKLDPKRLAELYKKAGARFLLIQGVHHDNYDMWNSRYQPWNSVNIGPKRDLLKEWIDACKKLDMNYGVAFHHEYTWWWWQTAFASDKRGQYAGVPYDGHLTLEDGKGKWWEGYDPRMLYGIDLREYETVEAMTHTGWSPPKPGIYSHHLDYAKWYTTQWALRMMDVVANYDPDFIYTDGTVQGPFTGDGTGTGYKCNAMQTVLADFYNRALKKDGEVDKLAMIKFRRPTNGSMTTEEHNFPDDINTSQPWIRELPVGDWFYSPGFHYEASMMIRAIIESISRDGNIAINICLRPDGSIEEPAVKMLEDLGKWMDVNGEGVYGSKAWKIPGEGEKTKNGKLKKLPGGGLQKHHAEFPFNAQDIRFTEGKDGAIYAFCMASPEGGQTVKIYSMGKAACYMQNIKDVTLLGHEGTLQWKQTDEALEIFCPATLPFQTSVVFRVNE